MASATLIPDRRRKYFPRNGGPRPTEMHRIHGHEGIAVARARLDATKPPLPGEPAVKKPLTRAQLARARKGIAQARTALEDSTRSNRRAGS